MIWQHGYYADSGYTFGYYPETMPLRLRWAALIQGHLAPIEGFRYLDAGCGQGFNLILAAIAHPRSEFVGIDFLPEHVAHARALAQRCGLRNVTFLEGDFIDLARDPSALGEYDYAVCHGISTWIAPEVKSSLFRMIGQVLKPGGVFYNSYNTFPGWLSVVPFQHLVLLEQRSQAGGPALKKAQQNIERLSPHAPQMFSTLPQLSKRLEKMSTQDPAYLVQEYNNKFWQPVFVSQMMDEMAAVKLSYLGTATLPEAYDAALHTEVRKLLAEQGTPLLREQLRDYALNQAFRRDLYVKGLRKPWVRQQNDLLKACRLAVKTIAQRPEEGKPFLFQAGSVELRGAADFYHSLLDFMGSHPTGVTVGEVISSVRQEAKRPMVMQALSMMLAAGYIVLQQEAPSAIQANAALAEANVEGGPYRYVALPRTGGAEQMPDQDWFFLDALLKQVPAEAWVNHVITELGQVGRVPSREGKAVADRAVQQQIIGDSVKRFTDLKLPYLKAMGALD